MIFSYALILPVWQLQKQQLMTSQIRSVLILYSQFMKKI